MKNSFLLILFLGVFQKGALAAIDSVEDSNLLKFTEEEVGRDIELLDKKEKALQAEINEKIKLYHSYKNGAAQPRFMWEDSAPVEAKRGELKKLLSLSITSGLKMLSLIQDQKASLVNERELLRVEKEQKENAGTSTKTSFVRPNYHFLCRSSPVVIQAGMKMKVLESYGNKNDKDTGVTWRSQGWWLAQNSAPVRTCSEGQVAFSGEIPGRGWVVMVDHGQSVMTVYANLNRGSINQIIQKGQKIAAGTILGNSQERFYFETRFEGKSVDPKKVLGSQILQDFAL